MPVELLSPGVVHTITDTVVRALPSKSLRLYVTVGTATSIDLSNNLDMTGAKNSVPATGAAFLESGAENAFAFLRVNGGTAKVRLV